jgi:hypothetical protein
MQSVGPDLSGKPRIGPDEQPKPTLAAIGQQVARQLLALRREIMAQNNGVLRPQPAECWKRVGESFFVGH